MIKILNTKSKDFKKKFNYYLNIRRKYSSSKISVVKKIVNDVKNNKDKSLIKYEKKFNKIKSLNANKLFYSKNEIEKSVKTLDKKIKNSIDTAFKRIFNFHKNQRFKSFKIKDNFNNSLSYRSKPINKIGVYVPGGRASYPSSVLMNCIPALIAGVKEIYMTVPSINRKIKTNH